MFSSRATVVLYMSVVTREDLENREPEENRLFLHAIHGVVSTRDYMYANTAARIFNLHVGQVDSVVQKKYYQS